MTARHCACTVAVRRVPALGGGLDAVTHTGSTDREPTTLLIHAVYRHCSSFMHPRHSAFELICAVRSWCQPFQQLCLKRKKRRSRMMCSACVALLCSSA
eukprot:2390060-Pleurochrysis_carterae.AAC.7